MDVNGMTGQGAPAPDVSPVVRTPAPVSRKKQAVTPAPPARDVVEPRHEERVQPVKDRFAADKAAKVRGGTRLRLDQATHQIVAQIVNQNNEVIKQIPPEEVLKIAARFRKVVGLIFNQRI